MCLYFHDDTVVPMELAVVEEASLGAAILSGSVAQAAEVVVVE